MLGHTGAIHRDRLRRGCHSTRHFCGRRHMLAPFRCHLLRGGIEYLGEVEAFQPFETRVDDAHATNILR